MDVDDLLLSVRLEWRIDGTRSGVQPMAYDTAGQEATAYMAFPSTTVGAGEGTVSVLLNIIATDPQGNTAESLNDVGPLFITLTDCG